MHGVMLCMTLKSHARSHACSFCGSATHSIAVCQHVCCSPKADLTCFRWSGMFLSRLDWFQTESGVKMRLGSSLGFKIMRQVMHGTCSYSIETIIFIGSYSIGGYLGENNPGSIETMGWTHLRRYLEDAWRCCGFLLGSPGCPVILRRVLEHSSGHFVESILDWHIFGVWRFGQNHIGRKAGRHMMWLCQCVQCNHNMVENAFPIFRLKRKCFLSHRHEAMSLLPGVHISIFFLTWRLRFSSIFLSPICLDPIRLR